MPLKKWRPSFRCLYVVPEAAGNAELLELLLDRLLPLRKWSGQEDEVIFLGGYVGPNDGGSRVLDSLITIQKEYPDRTTFLCGDSEHLFLQAFNGEREYKDWMMAGGFSTISGYLREAGMKSDPGSFPYSRLRDIVPKSHIDFLSSLLYSHERDGYFFVHGGVNYKLGKEESNPISYAFDTSSLKHYIRGYREGNEPAFSGVVVACHNIENEPQIYPHYFALGGGAPDKLYCLDLNSMEAVRARRGKGRIYPTVLRMHE